MRRSGALVAACMALIAAACGDEPTEAAKVAEAYNDTVDAVRDGDYEKACEGLSERTLEDLGRAGQVQQTKGCDKTLERTIEDLGTDKEALVTVQPADVRIDGPRSAAVGRVRMSKSGDEWKVEGDLDFVRPFLSGAPPR